MAAVAPGFAVLSELKKAWDGSKDASLSWEDDGSDPDYDMLSRAADDLAEEGLIELNSGIGSFNARITKAGRESLTQKR
jgi:hypothetical protein